MKTKVVFFTLLFLKLFHAIPGIPVKISVPSFFIKNSGQMSEEFKYNLKSAGSDVYFLKDRLIYRFTDIVSESPEHNAPFMFDNLEVKFVNSNSGVTFSEDEILNSKTNFITGNEPDKWIKDVVNFQTLTYNNLFDYIDLKYYSKNKQLKYDFVVNPGGDVADIKMQFNGQTEIRINKTGNLEISTARRKISEHIPVAYQIIHGKKIIVPVKYHLYKNEVSFIANPYDKNYQLVIDPILFYSTYVGGSGDDLYLVGNQQRDAQGNIYTAGYTNSPNFPAVSAYSGTYGGGNYDAFIFKLNSTGSALIYSTYIGGTAFDRINDIKLDPATNELYACGSSWSPNFPVTAGTYQTVHASPGTSGDCTIYKLSASGNSLVFSTFVGGTVDETATAMLIDVNNDLWFTGQSQGGGFPTTPGAYDQVWSGDFDCTVFKMNNTGTTLYYSTFLGNNLRDGGHAISIDNAGNIYVGTHTAGNFPTTAGAFDVTYNGGVYDMAVSKLDPTVSNLLYSTYIGGSGDDWIKTDLHVDNAGNTLFSGNASSGFPTTTGAYDVTFNGGNSDVYVAELNASGTALNFCTLIGAAGDDGAWMSTKDPSGNIVVTGYCSDNYPVTPCCYDPTYNGGNSDVFISILNPTCTALLYSTYYGGSGNDVGWAITANADTFYVSGQTNSPNFPTTTGAYDVSFNGGISDYFVFKIYLGVTPPVSDFTTTTIPCSLLAGFSNLSTNATTYSWLFGDGGTSTVTSPNHTYSASGQYTVTLIADPGTGCADTSEQTINISSGPTPQFTFAQNNCHFSVVLNNTSLNSSNYSWDFGDGTNSNQLNPTHTYPTFGTYTISLTADTSSFCADSVKKVVTFADPSPIANFTGPSGFCIGTSAIFSNTSVNAQTYTWNFGDGSATSTQSSPSHQYNSTGTYTVQLVATNTVCSTRDTTFMPLTVTPGPVLNLGNDTTVCASGLSLFLDAGNPGGIYQWNTGDISQSIPVNYPGVYSVTVSLAGCVSRDTIKIESFNFTLGPDINLCNASSVVLKPENLNVVPTKYTWSTGSHAPAITVQEEGYYSLIIQDGACIIADTVKVTGGDDTGTLWVPNTFTPDGDGLNDNFKPTGTDIESYNIKIFNRWGQMIYESGDIEAGWNGIYKGTEAENGTYVYLIKYTTNCSGKTPLRKSGQVQIIR